MTGIEAAGKVRQHLPDCRVLMLTTFDDEAYIVGRLDRTQLAIFVYRNQLLI